MSEPKQQARKLEKELKRKGVKPADAPSEVEPEPEPEPVFDPERPAPQTSPRC